MNGNYLLDTNIVIALFANDTGVLQQLTAASQICIPSIVLGELYYRVNKSAHSKSNIAHIDNFGKAGRTLVSYVTY